MPGPGAGGRQDPGCGRVVARQPGRFGTNGVGARLVAAGLSAALSEAARYWAEQDGAPPLTALMDQAVTTFEPLLDGLG